MEIRRGDPATDKNLSISKETGKYTFLYGIPITLGLSLTGNFPHMNFSQLHERLRLELVRRIDRGVLTGSMLAHQTGFGQAHISNFLRKRRVLSLQGLDRVLDSQLLTVSDLLPDELLPSHRATRAENAHDTVPLVSDAIALQNQNIPHHYVLDVLRVPAGILQQFRSRRATSRKDWLRFVAIRINAIEALPMEPILSPAAIVVIDRHYTSLVRYQPAKPTLYAVRDAHTLLIRYVDFEANRLVLRPHNPAYPVVLLELGSNETPSDYVIGRACFLLAPL